VTRVAVVGPGLMGGSLLRDLSEAGWSATTWAPGAGVPAGALPGITVAASLEVAMEEADGVVLATPLSALPGLMDELRAWTAVTWVTDVGSLQLPPLTWARARGLEARYVTSHPLCGGEESGFSASRAGLYRGARIWLSGSAREEARSAVSALWEAVGGTPAWVDARQHDQGMARISHLPQVVSTHLAAALAEAGVPRGDLGPGGRDVTRLAGSDPRMWQDILAAGGGPLPEALRALARRLATEADRLEAGDSRSFADLLASTRSWSRS
jgi:prephenate dehydrogenase